MRTLFITSVLTLLIDQISKYVVVIAMDLQSRGAIDVVPPILNFRMAWNRGVNFGLFSNDGDTGRWVLIGLAVVISVWVVIWVLREGAGRWGLMSAGLLVGGALGNVVDRLWYGAVADFLNMSCSRIENPFDFNVADVAIFAGALGLVFFTGSKKPS